MSGAGAFLFGHVDAPLLRAVAGAAQSDGTASGIFLLASLLGDAEVRLGVAALVLAGLLLTRRWRPAAFFFLAIAASALLCALAKELVGRPRPDIVPHLERVTSPSFPSGHAWNGMAVFGGIGWLMAGIVPARWRVTVLALSASAVLLVGLSRLALGVHWPSDVLAGWIGGLVTLFAADRVVARWRPADAEGGTQESDSSR